MTPNSLPGVGVAGKATRRRAVRPHATALLWAAWLLLVVAFVTWRALT